MTETADVVIIGSGIVGSSVAYHLAEQGCTNVLVIEREAHQGKGSTGKSMGGVRAQFSTAVNIQMSRYSIDFFSRFDEVVGHPADYRAHGYLFCATNERHLDYLKTNRERQMALGVKNVELVSREDILKFVPQLRVDDIIGGTFCPTDGFVDPHSVMMGFMLKARERGVRLWLDTQVTGIETEPRILGPRRLGTAGVSPRHLMPRSASETSAVQYNGRITGVMTHARLRLNPRSSSTPPGHGPHKSHAWPAPNCRSNLCAVSWFPPNLSINCRSAFRWSSTCPPVFISAAKEKEFCWPGTIRKKRFAPSL